MVKKGKCIFIAAMVLTFSLTMVGNSVSAAENSSKLSSTKEYIYEVTYPNGTSLRDSKNYNEDVTVKDPTFDGIVDKDGNITVPTKANMKVKYLEKFNKDPQKYKDSINNIDKIVDETINIIQNAKTKKSISSDIDLSSSEFAIAGILSTSYWRIEPYITESIRGITYSTLWVGFDNYRSSVATNCTYEKSSSTEKTLGFTGDAEIKSKFGFSASYTQTQKATITTSNSIDAWTIWDTRPYIAWTKNTYLGAWTTETYNPLTGNTTYSTREKNGVNLLLNVSNNEAWSAYNSAHSNTATSPLPPTGTPNVAWQ